MTSKKRFLGALMAALLFLTMPAASAFTVFDPMVHMQTVMNRIQTAISNNNEVQMIRGQVEQLAQLLRTYDQLKRQYEVLTGDYGFARIFTDKYGRSFPKDWRGAIDWAGNGQFSDYRSYYYSRYPQYAPEQIDPSNPNSREVRLYEDAEHDTTTTMATAQTALVAASRRMNRLDDMVLRIDDTPGIKAAGDLGNRISAELGYAITDLTVVTAALTQVTAGSSRKETEAQKSKTDFLTY